MRTDSFLLFGSILISSILIILSKPITPKRLYIQKAIGTINTSFQNDLQNFSEATVSFQEAIKNYREGSITETSLHEEYRHLRDAFKRVEWGVEYLDKEAADKLMNGAPLPKLEAKVADLVVLQPKGMQVIDELIDEKPISTEIVSLQKMAAKLQTDAFQIQQYLLGKKMTDRQFFEATRQAIIRLAALGITGFDTPGTTQGIEDARIVLGKIKNNIEQYNEELTHINRSNLLSVTKKLLQHGERLTEHQNFEEFNRLVFIKEVLNPLYENLYKIHYALGYETINEVTKYLPAVNYATENIFAKDFINRFYFVSLADDATFKKKAALGKLLFYDPLLSSNNTMACASCHAPDKAFTDAMVKSLSNKGTPLKRNAMTLNYSVYAKGFFHDMRTKRLEDQFEHVVVSTDEFATDYKTIVSKLAGSEQYISLFNEAFPNQTNTIKTNDIDYALVAYIMQLNPFDSMIDKYMRGEITTLPNNVQDGFNLFTGKAACATCHFMPLFSGTVPPFYNESESEVLGVPASNETPKIIDADLGRLGNGLTQEVAPFWKHSFKTPTLRNIGKTKPYMHNGVFGTLEEVMDFYNEGGGAGRGMNLEHQTLASDPLNLTEEEIANIIAFMKALTDTKTFSAPLNLPRDFKNNKLNSRELIK